jgi:hypothetical protein
MRKSTDISNNLEGNSPIKHVDLLLEGLSEIRSKERQHLISFFQLVKGSF